MTSNKILIQATHVNKYFKKKEGSEIKVLEDVNFQMHTGEVVAILGKSGSGKSTFLRILAGLIQPSAGEVYYRGQRVLEPCSGIAMVFQSFALLPWLTVLQNVELGLEAKGIPETVRRARTLSAIDAIGLDGFESAYPRELSGGMRQRVGFARALVVEPELLLMDEPFSALDILTAENLRNDLMDLWHSQHSKTKGILCVTHDIEEAVLIANRIVIFSNNPGRILSEITVDLPFPRNISDAKFQDLVDEVYLAMTDRERAARQVITATMNVDANYAYYVPDADISELNGLLENILNNESDGVTDLPELADMLQLDIGDLLQFTEALDVLKFAKILDGSLVLTAAGREYAGADLLNRKQLFAHHLMAYIPLARHISASLNVAMNHRLHKNVFIHELIDCFSEEEAERLLKTVIDWGRYAEVFAYDHDVGELSLENPQ
jgi:NitT/TauT family transport system ATP-binding protein